MSVQSLRHFCWTLGILFCLTEGFESRIPVNEHPFGYIRQIRILQASCETQLYALLISTALLWHVNGECKWWYVTENIIVKPEYWTRLGSKCGYSPTVKKSVFSFKGSGKKCFQHSWWTSQLVSVARCHWDAVTQRVTARVENVTVRTTTCHRASCETNTSGCKYFRN